MTDSHDTNHPEHDEATGSESPLLESRIRPPNAIEATSTRLLRNAADGDQVAWRKLVELYGPIVRYWCRRAGLNRSDIGDVFSETFVAVVRNLPKFERQEGQAKFRAWLKTVTMSKVADHRSRLAKNPAAAGGSTAIRQLGEIEAASASDPTNDSAANEITDEALDHSEEAFLAQRMLQIIRGEFREKTWQAFYRTAIEGLTSAEAAAELDMTALAVRKAKSRVMQRLKESLGDSAPA